MGGMSHHIRTVLGTETPTPKMMDLVKIIYLYHAHPCAPPNVTKYKWTIFSR